MRLTNKVAVEKLLSEVQARARVRCLSYTELAEAVERAEKRLRALGIPRRAWTGCRIVFEPARVPNSYRGVPKGTYAVLEFHRRSWHVVEVHRDQAKRHPYGALSRMTLHLTDAAKAEVKPLKL